MKNRKFKIPTILGVIILLAGVFAGVYLVRTNQIFKAGASVTATPEDVRVSNITDTSATVSWATAEQTTGFINWGVSESSINKIENETANDQKFVVHSITISGLSPNTNYFYKINSQGESFDNNGVPWQFATGAALSQSQNSIPVSGSVITASGQPSKRALVYVNVNGYLLSTTTSDTGNFVLQLGSVRTPDLTSYFGVDLAKTLLEVSVASEDGETASAQIFPQSANPIPPLVLGTTKDYRGLAPSGDTQNPGVDINLPTGSEGSKFDTSTSSAKTKNTTVILESITEGETVTSTQPEFFGKGPGGEKITITVHSETPVTGTVTIPNSGSWQWSPPAGLAPGAHSITISWIDTSGITRTLTRNFIVQAGELPAFVSTPSGSTPTPTAIATPIATATPTATPRATATPTPVPTLNASPSASPAMPTTGDLTPTIILSIMGLAVMLFSVVVWKKAES